MIRLSRESNQMSNPAPLHDVLESKDTIERLLGNMFSSESPSDVVVVNGISVLLTILRDRWVLFGVSRQLWWALFGVVVESKNGFFFYTQCANDRIWNDSDHGHV